MEQLSRSSKPVDFYFRIASWLLVKIKDVSRINRSVFNEEPLIMSISNACYVFDMFFLLSNYFLYNYPYKLLD